MKILAIGAHPDDVELAMAGTLIKHRKVGDDVKILICTKGGVDNNPIRVEEAKNAVEIIGARLDIWDYPVTKLNRYNKKFSILLNDFIDSNKPDRIYVHSMYDLHQVHVNVSKCTLTASKNIKQIIFYESLSSTTKDFKPNAYVDITNEIEEKIRSIETHRTQTHRLYMHRRVNLYLRTSQ